MVAKSEEVTKRRRNRFSEHHEDKLDDHPATTHRGGLGHVTGLDGTDDRFAGRVGDNGFETIARQNEEAANLWERSLQHARETSSKTSKLPRSRSSIWAGSDRSTGARTPARSILFPDTDPNSIPLRKLSRSRSVDTSDIAPDTVVAEPQQQNYQPKLSIENWARWPSHTRAERSGSAGFSDQVSTYDFAANIEPSTSVTTGKPRKRKKHHSMTFGFGRKAHNVANQYKFERSDFLRLEAGHRSSVSAGGAVRYPDLELLPRQE